VHLPLFVLIRRSQKTAMHFHLKRAVSGLACCVLIAFPSKAQILSVADTTSALHPSGQTTAANGSASQSDPAAVAEVAKALSALGGVQAWQRIGGAAAQVSLTRADGKAETLQWSDDWHLGYVLARRDSLSGNSAGVSMITQQNGRVLVSPGGTTHTQPRENDFTLLAAGYPGAVLAQSIAAKNCSFNISPLSSIDPSPIAKASTVGDTKIEELCYDPTMPMGKARLTWVFSKSTSLPRAVQLPVRGLLHNSVQYETVVFVSFQQIQGLIIPAKLTITRPDGTTDALSIANASFAASLPSTVFQVGQ
jgi:hypothetical protein